MDNFLEIRNVVKRYAAHTALSGVSLNIPRGKVFGLLGPNGAGKTTLIRIINRITAPDEGEVIFDGHKFEADDVKRIGYLPEERGLYKKMKVGEQAIYLAQLKGLSREEAKKRLSEWFNKFEISAWWNKKLEELSKGMQQKVQFIITILHEPPLLIFDEPFSGFDPVNAELLKREILQLRDKGHTIIYSTHNMASVEDVCDEIALINNSKVVLTGNVQEVKSRFRSGLYDVVLRNGELLPRPEAYAVLKKEVIAGTTRYHLQKAAELTNSELISLVAKDAEVLSFSEQLPSMNDVFLKVVNQSHE